MADTEFPEYAVQQNEYATSSKRGFSAEQIKVLDEVIWNLAENPGRFSPRQGTKGQLVYTDPASGIELVYRVDDARKVLYFYHFSAPLPSRRTIFISYSRQDSHWLNLLRKFLGILEKEGIIKFWHDGYIKPGEPWESSIREALDGACAAVLLVSQDFLVSEFITTYELPRLLSDAERGGKKIFWIPVSPSTVFESNKEITVFQSLADDPLISLEELSEAQQKKVLVQAYQKLREAMRS